MLTLVLSATSFTTPARTHRLTTRACTRMQFEEETTDSGRLSVIDVTDEDDVTVWLALIFPL